MDRRDFMKEVIGTGIVAGSTVAFGDYAKLFGAEPIDIPHIQLAAEMNLGRIDLHGLSINRIKL
jgi:hypothetical protein